MTKTTSTTVCKSMNKLRFNALLLIFTMILAGLPQMSFAMSEKPPVPAEEAVSSVGNDTPENVTWESAGSVAEKKKAAEEAHATELKREIPETASVIKEADELIEEVQETLEEVDETLEEVLKDSSAHEKADDSAKTEEELPPAVLMIEDFEDDDDKHNLVGGENGSWNMDPTDINDSYCDADVVEIAGIDGKPTKVMQLDYSVESEKASQNGFWTKLNDFDASHHDHLAFDIKGDAEKGFTRRFKIELKKFKPGSDTEKIKGTFKIDVTENWETVQIALNRITGIIDFADPAAWQNPAVARKNLDEFVIVFQDRHVSEKTGRIYFDNLRFVRTGNPGPTAVDFPPRTKEKTETKIEGVEFAKFLIGRLGGFPKEKIVNKEFPTDDREFLMEIAKDTWRFFDEIVDQEHGLVLDTIQMGDNAALDEGTWIGDYTNVTNIGVYLMTVVAGYELGFIDRAGAIERLRKTMNTLEKIDYHVSGFPYNYYDTTTAERTSYFVSLVDSGWLVAGLYVAKNAFLNELGDQAQKLLDRGDLVFFYDPVERQMFHGYYEHLKVYSDYHYGVYYTEPRASSYIAIARGEVPEEHWFGGMIRTFPPKFGWQTQKPKHRIEGKVLDYKYYGGYYEWKGLKYIPTWGGSAFEALMPTIMIKEKELSPNGLALNNAAHAKGQIMYALDELGYEVWGMSPSAIPEGGYTEYGAKPMGAKGYKPGAVTPHASALAIEYEPEAVIKNFRKLIELYDIYGEYGFYDSVNVKTGVVSRRYLALDQGMLFIALTNYLKNGVIREHFHSDPVMKRGEKLLTYETFFGQLMPDYVPPTEAA